MAQTGNKCVHPTKGRAGLSRVDTADTIVGENLAWLSTKPLEHGKLGRFIMSKVKSKEALN